MEPLSAHREGHGPPDDLIDHPGCHRCHGKTRAYTTIAGEDYCDSCADMVKSLDWLHEALVGTGEP